MKETRYWMLDTGCWIKRRAICRASRIQDSESRIGRRAFTLIEIMVVVAIMGIILSTGIPSIYRIYSREGMRAAVNSVLEVCSHARAQAILRGTTVTVVFHPMERRFEITGSAAPSAPQPEGEPGGVAERPASASVSGQSGQIPDDVVIEMLDINLWEYKEADEARVRFFPDGTCDELTLILRSSKNEWKKISLEVTTGLTSLENMQ